MSFPRVCPICGEPFAATDTVVYLRAEDVLLHRACCVLHPRCHCRLSVTPARPTDCDSDTAATAA